MSALALLLLASSLPAVAASRPLKARVTVVPAVLEVALETHLLPLFPSQQEALAAMAAPPQLVVQVVQEAPPLLVLLVVQAPLPQLATLVAPLHLVALALAVLAVALAVAQVALARTGQLSRPAQLEARPPSQPVLPLRLLARDLLPLALRSWSWLLLSKCLLDSHDDGFLMISGVGINKWIH